MIRPRRDIDDLDNLFGRDEAKRLREERADMVATGTERMRQENARDAATKKRVVEFMFETSRLSILAEYRAAGVEPRPGVALISLSLLLRFGWRIDEFNGEKTLVAPPALPTWEGPRDRDSLPTRKEKR